MNVHCYTQKAGGQRQGEGMNGWSYLDALRMAELREEWHNTEFVFCFCNLDPPGFSLALLSPISVLMGEKNH